MIWTLSPTRQFLWKAVILLSLLKSSSQQPIIASRSNSNSTISIKIVGTPVSVWSCAETWKNCHYKKGQIDFADIPARAFVVDGGAPGSSDETTKIRINVGGIGYHEMHGPNLLNQTRSCQISWNATFDPDPSMFAGNEFLDSWYRFDNGTAVSLIHTEFPGTAYNACDTFRDETFYESTHGIRTNGGSHARKRPIRRRLGSNYNQQPLTYPTCWTVTIGLAISNDLGLSWSHIAKPPNHLVAAVPYGYNQSHLAYGWGDPSNIVRSPIDCTDNDMKDGNSADKRNQNGHDTDGSCYYYVAMFNRHPIGEQAAGICIARTKQLLDPKSWRAWNGRDFSVPFANPYAPQANDNDTFDPKDHVCEPTILPGLPDPEGCPILGLVWSEYLQKFVATIGCLVGPYFGEAFYFSTSKDLVHWSHATKFYDRETDLPPEVAAQTRAIHYPTLMDPNEGGLNFDTIGQHPYLFWVSIGHSPYTDGRHLWATPIRFDIDSDKEVS